MIRIDFEIEIAPNHCYVQLTPSHLLILTLISLNRNDNVSRAVAHILKFSTLRGTLTRKENKKNNYTTTMEHVSLIHILLLFHFQAIS